MGDVRATQGFVLASSDSGGGDVRVGQAWAFAGVKFPSDAVQVTQSFIQAATQADNVVNVYQAYVLVAVRGVTDTPRIRAWTFTQDGHDFYVLRLGDTGQTLVYDTYSQQWSVYGSGDGDPWRAATGRNWLGGRPLALNWSDVIVGDDALGVLYFLSPDDDYDDDPVNGSDELQPFRRRVTGQIVVKPGYASAPCFGVQLYGSIGSGPGTLNVNLAVSDDRGFNYDDMGDIALDAGDYNARVNWLSLGSMEAPGRLFRITDDGSLKRIDSLEMD